MSAPTLALLHIPSNTICDVVDGVCHVFFNSESDAQKYIAVALASWAHNYKIVPLPAHLKTASFTRSTRLHPLTPEDCAIVAHQIACSPWGFTPCIVSMMASDRADAEAIASYMYRNVRVTHVHGVVPR